MSVPITTLQILRLILQIEQNLGGLQRDFRANAASWKASAQAQTVDVMTLAGWMSDASVAYKARLGWLTTLQANTTLWAKCGALWTLLGGTAAEFTALITPFATVANQLGTVDKSSYAAIISACDQIMAYIDAPPNLWPE